MILKVYYWYVYNINKIFFHIFHFICCDFYFGDTTNILEIQERKIENDQVVIICIFLFYVRICKRYNKDKTQHYKSSF